MSLVKCLYFAIIVSFVLITGDMYCWTMKAMKDVLGTQEKQLLELGQQMSNFRPQSRLNIAVALEKLANLSSSYKE